MTFTSSLRFLYIFDQSGLLCAMPLFLLDDLLSKNTTSDFHQICSVSIQIVLGLGFQSPVQMVKCLWNPLHYTLQSNSVQM